VYSHALSKFSRFLAGAIALGCAPWACAQTAGAAHDVSTASPPASAAPVSATSAWDVSTTLRGSFGWRKNVTLSAVNPVDQPFWRLEAESFVLRETTHDWRFMSFLTADVLRYFRAPTLVTEQAAAPADDPRNRHGDGTVSVERSIPGEQQWAGAVEARWQPRPGFRTAVKTLGFLQDVFIDPSETEGSPEPATHVRLAGGYVLLAPHLALPGWFAIEPSFQLKRVDYRSGYPGDYNASRPGVQLAWSRTERLVVSAAWYEHRRHYSNLLASRVRGRPIPGRLLGLGQRELELKVATTFHRGGTWTLSASANRLENRDRAEGFLDYDRRRLEVEVAWDRGPWHGTADIAASRQDYLRQTVGFGNQLSPRIADDYDTTARLERDLPGQWTVFAENRWERNRSNIRDAQYRFSYRTDTVLAGVQRTF
jgi:hypothetical protein